MFHVVRAPNSNGLTTPARRIEPVAAEVTTRHELSPVDERLRILSQLTQSLLRQLLQQRIAENAWSQLRELVESLPLTTDEFARCLNRLTNAERYVAQGELGAAKFELRIFVRQVSPTVWPPRP